MYILENIVITLIFEFESFQRYSRISMFSGLKTYTTHDLILHSMQYLLLEALESTI